MSAFVRVAACASGSAPLWVCVAIHAQVIYSNGPLSTGAVTESGVTAPSGRTWSETQHNTGNNTESNTSAGFNGQSGSFRLADQFTVPANQRWTLTGVQNHAYRTGYTGVPSPFVAGTLRIWRGRPGDASSLVVFGDTSANRLVSSTDELVYRIFNTVVPPPGIAPTTTRRLWRTTLSVSPPLALGPGVYWVDYDLAGPNFHSSVTLPGNRGNQPPQGWNARQFSSVTGLWQDLLDLGSPGSAPDVPQDLAFELTGSIETNVQVGACCLPDHTCTTALDSPTCSTMGGLYQGNNAACSRCQGACCAANGGCVIRGPFECQQSGGVYIGGETDCGMPTYGVQFTTTAFSDISTTGTPLVLDSGNADEGSGNAVIGFPFVFYGATFSTVRVGTNGYLVFTANPADGNISLTSPIPSVSAPNNFIAPLWDDLDATGSPPIVTQTLGAAPNRTFIAQWTNVGLFQVGDSDHTFQVVLFESSNLIEFRYESLNPDPAHSAIRGVENSTGMLGVGIAGPAQSHTAVMLVPAGLQCPQPAGACCLLSGSCAYMAALECQLNSGNWRGAGVPCAQAGCTSAGACCLAGGECQILSQAACASEAGEYQGDQSTCGPNPCVGRCCFDSGSCEVMLGEECVISGGTYAGGGSTCAGNPCGGACCRSDGTCTFTSSVGCAQLGGRYQGDGTLCGPSTCLGGCCLPNQSCQLLSSSVCQTSGGQYRGDGSTCGGYSVQVSPNAFEDISATGSRVIGGDTLPDTGSLDDGSTLVALPFSFSYFSVAQSSIRISTNGFMLFGGPPTAGSDFSNDPIPSTLEPNNIICPAWDDYRLTPASGAIHTQTVGVVGQRRFVIQWTDCELFQDPAPPNNTFQALLYESTGLIEFRYAAMNSVPPRSASIGVENVSGELGVSASDNSIGTGQTARFIVPMDACVTPATGACCMGVTCLTRTQLECQMNSGRYLGNGVGCTASVCTPVTTICLPGDTNLDRRLDGDDLPGISRALIVGPTDSQFCFVDANPDGIITQDDLSVIINALMRWPNANLNGSDFWPIGASCDVGRRMLVFPCHPSHADTDLAIRNHGAPGDCAVFIQRRTCAGVDIGAPMQVPAGTTGCLRLVAGNEQVVAWCAAGGSSCRISMKYVTGGTCVP